MKVLLSGCLLAVSSAMLAGCHGGESAAPTAAQTVQASVVQSRQQQVPLFIHATGTIHARETAIVSAQLAGRIQQVLVREGDSVRAGQLLVVLDDAAQRASVDQAQSAAKAVQNEQSAAQTDAKLATTTLERYRKLQAEKSVSAQEMDEVTHRADASAARLEALRAQSDAARSQEKGARIMQGYARLHAPFAGVVTVRLADPGTLASPGAPLLQVDSGGPLQLVASVDESSIGLVHKGMKVPIIVGSAPSAGITGTVAEIAPAADPASRSFLVKIDVPSSGALHAGVYGTADFATGTRQAILVPRSSVVLRGSLACAYVLDGRNIAQLRYLTLGAAQGDLVEVLSGISAGERLVDQPSDRDLAGKLIEAQR
jgi:RND family efflux transporter MFP subunit